MSDSSWASLQLALERHHGKPRWPKYAQANPDEPTCICPFVDVGVGPLMQHGVDPECPVCSPEPIFRCSCADWRWLLAYTRADAREGDEIDVYCTIHGE